MPVVLNVPDWGEVTALSVREVCKRLNVYPEDVEFWIECELFQYYTMNETNRSGKTRKRVHYIDAVDLADAEKLHERLDGPIDRALWYRYELRDLQKKHGMPDPRSTERTMVQPGRSSRQQRVPSVQPQVQPVRRHPPLPPALQDVDEYADAPTVRDEEFCDDYDAFEEEEEEELVKQRPRWRRPEPPATDHYPRQVLQRPVQPREPQQRPVQRKQGAKQLPPMRKESLLPQIPDWRRRK
jgi:hypothetical protein